MPVWHNERLICSFSQLSKICVEEHSSNTCANIHSDSYALNSTDGTLIISSFQLTLPGMPCIRTFIAFKQYLFLVFFIKKICADENDMFHVWQSYFHSANDGLKAHFWNSLLIIRLTWLYHYFNSQ